MTKKYNIISLKKIKDKYIILVLVCDKCKHSIKVKGTYKKKFSLCCKNKFCTEYNKIKNKFIFVQKV